MNEILDALRSKVSSERVARWMDEQRITLATYGWDQIRNGRYYVADPYGMSKFMIASRPLKPEDLKYEAELAPLEFRNRVTTQIIAQIRENMGLQ